MDQNKRQAVALMKYSAIAPLISGTQDDYGSLRAYYRDASARGVTAPDGQVRHYSPGTIQKWHLAYKSGGFDALLPTGRSDCGVSRKIDPGLEEEIRYIKHTYPRLSAAEIYRQLRDKGSIKNGQLSESTVLRFVNQMMLRERLTNNQDMRRYERPHINEVWYGDTCYGPYLSTPDGKKRVFFIALIDDASRMIVAADVFFQDNFISLMSVIRSAVSRYGRPSLFTFDNGSAYRNSQMELLAARIGSSVHYCEPFTPTSKSKIERWFLTMRMQFLASLDMRSFHSIEELRKAFASYIHRYNQAPHSSLKGISPQDRFFSEPEFIRRLSEEAIENSFLLETDRRVSPDSVLSLNNREYEIHYRYAKQRIRLRYSPDLSKTFVVEPSGDLVPVSLRLLNKQDNSQIRRIRVRLSEGGAGA